MRRIVLFSLLIGSLFLFSNCSLLQGLMDIRQPRVSVTSVKLGTITAESVALDVVLDIENPTQAELPLAGLKTVVKMDGLEKMTVQTDLAGKTLTPGMGNMIPVKLTVPLSVMKEVAEILVSDATEILLGFDNTVSFSSTMPLSASFSFEKSIPKPVMPKFSLGSPSVSMAGFTTLRFSIGISAENKGKIPFKGVSLSGGFYVDGKQIGDCNAVFDIKAQSTSSSTVNLDIGIADAGIAVINSLKSGSANIKLKAVLNTPFGQKQLEI